MRSKNDTRVRQITGRLSNILVALALGCAITLPAQAATDTAKSGVTKTSKKKSTKVHSPRSASEESTAERDRRLYRECKGMPNAGACLGYTRR